MKLQPGLFILVAGVSTGFAEETCDYDNRADCQKRSPCSWNPKGSPKCINLGEGCTLGDNQVCTGEHCVFKDELCVNCSKLGSKKHCKSPCKYDGQTCGNFACTDLNSSKDRCKAARGCTWNKDHCEDSGSEADEESGSEPEEETEEEETEDESESEEDCSDLDIDACEMTEGRCSWSLHKNGKKHSCVKACGSYTKSKQCKNKCQWDSVEEKCNEKICPDHKKRNQCMKYGCRWVDGCVDGCDKKTEEDCNDTDECEWDAEISSCHQTTEAEDESGNEADESESEEDCSDLDIEACEMTDGRCSWSLHKNGKKHSCVKACGSYTKPQQCKNKCQWDSGEGKCNEKVCSDHKNMGQCMKYGCRWDDGCVEPIDCKKTEEACKIIDECEWEAEISSCHPKCSTHNDPKNCKKSLKCFWKGNTCKDAGCDAFLDFESCRVRSKHCWWDFANVECRQRSQCSLAEASKCGGEDRTCQFIHGEMSDSGSDAETEDDENENAVESEDDPLSGNCVQACKTIHHHKHCNKSTNCKWDDGMCKQKTCSQMKSNGCSSLGYCGMDGEVCKNKLCPDIALQLDCETISYCAWGDDGCSYTSSCSLITNQEICGLAGSCVWDGENGCEHKDCSTYTVESACDPISYCEWGTVCSHKSCSSITNLEICDFAGSCVRDGENGCENKECPDIDLQSDCEKISDCVWDGVNGCENKDCSYYDESGCNPISYCAWGDTECSYTSLCSSITNQEICGLADSCDWNGENDCENKLCPGIEPQSDCEKISYCEWGSECSYTSSCSSITNQEICDFAGSCVWGGPCREKVCSEYEQQAECETAGCDWNGTCEDKVIPPALP